MELYTLENITIPTQFEINKDIVIESENVLIRKRTEKGWTLDFIFNRNGNNWSDGSTFYYWGILDELNPLNFVDNNLSFSFTPNGEIMWESYRYSGYCDSGYTESYYISSGITPTLCPNGTSDDFNITIVFDRYKYFYDCDIENAGGSNDYITGWTVTNVLNVVSGATEQISGFTETLSKKWVKEQNSRLGILKIYLNGNPIYMIKDWEEVIPSERNSINGIYQKWGGGTAGYVDIHDGQTLFNMKKVTYYEEPLKFVTVKNNYLINHKENFSIVECQDECQDDLYGINYLGLILTEGGDYFMSEDNKIIIY